MPPVPILPGHDRGAPTTLTPHLLGNICWDFPLLHILHGFGKAHPAACPEMLRERSRRWFSSSPPHARCSCRTCSARAAPQPHHAAVPEGTPCQIFQVFHSLAFQLTQSRAQRGGGVLQSLPIRFPSQTGANTRKIKTSCEMQTCRFYEGQAARELL